MSAISANSSLSQIQLMNQINTAVMRKAFDAMEQQGEVALSLLQDAAEIQNRASESADGKGQLVDYLA